MTVPKVAERERPYLSPEALHQRIADLQKRMKEAALLRDEIKALEAKELEYLAWLALPGRASQGRSIKLRSVMKAPQFLNWKPAPFTSIYEPSHNIIVMPDLIPAKHGIFDRHSVPIWIPAFMCLWHIRRNDRCKDNYETVHKEDSQAHWPPPRQVGTSPSYPESHIDYSACPGATGFPWSDTDPTLSKAEVFKDSDG